MYKNILVHKIDKIHYDLLTTQRHENPQQQKKHNKRILMNIYHRVLIFMETRDTNYTVWTIFFDG